MRDRIMRTATGVLAGTLFVLSTACVGHGVRDFTPSGERVQIGYGTQARGDVMGSVASITEADIDESGSSHLEEILRGKVPGLDVVRLRNGDYSFRIRGVRSFLGGNEPLVVIDGLAASGRNAMDALSLVSPQSVARIDVLKDAGSLAAFGSRGVNGVILITTKR